MNLLRYSLERESHEPELESGVPSEVELPLNGVLRSWLPASNAQATPKIVHLSDTPAPIPEYATHVTDKGTP
jgi:hypothetical protein